MPQQLATSVDNNFTKGFITEATGLNFPENASTDTDNCIYSHLGDVYRRMGIDFEENYSTHDLDRTNKALSFYRWTNVGGDGSTEFIVVQAGGILGFFNASAATEASPLSDHLVLLANYATQAIAPLVFDETKECTFSDGNGYLFIYHPSIDPCYVSYAGSTLTFTNIQVKIRDFAGAVDGLPDNTRPSTLSTAHSYNLQNQGWTSGSPWALTSSSSVTLGTGAKAFTVAAGVSGISGGQAVEAIAYYPLSGIIAGWMGGTVTSYVGTTLTINSTGTAPPGVAAGPYTVWVIQPRGTGYVNSWFTSQGNYPSNADQWWRFKTAAGVFDPATTQPNISLSLGPAPKGHYIISAFQQDRTIVSGITGLTTVSTTTRPTNGCWFQGRVWYTGINASQAASGTADFTTWTENIYFSQVVNKVDDFSKCYQTNDPTSEELFDLLPTDGGVIVIQGCGAIYKLFPTQNGLLVFAANGIWFITGSQGIGFSAVDYTVTKISSIRSFSSCSYVDVNGYPVFWNEEGIYIVTPGERGGLEVQSLTNTTIDRWYAEIPLSCRMKARGSYHPVEYNIQWVFRSTEPTNLTETYEFDRILNYTTHTKAFFPFSFERQGIGAPSIGGVLYVPGPGGVGASPSTFKYLTFFVPTGPYAVTFSELNNDSYVDWETFDTVGVNFSSYFITGYKIRGQAIRKSQPQYVQVWSGMYEDDSGYKIQGVWDYAVDRNSNRWSGIQLADFDGTTYFANKYKRHKIRGHGYALQLKVQSQDGKPFNVIGWSIVDTINQGT